MTPAVRKLDGALVKYGLGDGERLVKLADRFRK